jgi:predicted N-formylglutamate amidohydrolase
MAGLDPAIHASFSARNPAWMPGSEAGHDDDGYWRALLAMANVPALSRPGMTALSPPLLSAADPPPVEAANPEGAAPFLFICDHASRAVPRRLGALGLSDEELSRHIGWDIGAAEVARRLSKRFDAPAILSGYSRLVVDCNRPTDDPTSIPAISDGVVVPGNRALAPEDVAGRVDACFHPYHRAIRRALKAKERDGRAPALLSIHSCTPELRGFARPWHVGVLWDKDGRIARPLMRALEARGGVCVGDNQPYSARTHSGYSIDAHANAVGLPHVMVEIRQDLIADQAGVARWEAVLGDALAPILADRSLYTRFSPAGAAP